ncbi:MAG TPA: hypothetical protein VFZ84_06975 [Burkholderiales bacterium]
MGKFLTLSFSVTALALLAACGSRQPANVVVVPPASPVVAAPQVATTPVVQAPALRTGFGRIETITGAPTASAGATAPSAMQRLGIRMDDGSLQYVDTASAGLSVGDRVELTREGYIRRHPTS